MTDLLSRIVAGVAAGVLLGPATTSAAVSQSIISVQDAEDVIGVVPHYPAADRPISSRGKVSESTDTLMFETVNPGLCDDGSGIAETPPKVCSRWKTAIRRAGKLHIVHAFYSGRHGHQILATAYVARDESAARRVFPVIEGIWTRGHFHLSRFSVHGLGVHATGLTGPLNMELDDFGLGYLWRVRNVIFEVFWERKTDLAPGRALAAFRPYADEIDRRAKTA